MWRSDSDKTLASSSTPPLPTMWPRFSWGIPALVTGQIGSLLYKTGSYYRATRQSQISHLPPCPPPCWQPGNHGPFSLCLSLSLSFLLPGVFTVGSLQAPSQHIHFRVCKDGRFFLARPQPLYDLVEDVSCNKRKYKKEKKMGMLIGLVRKVILSA